ncbi:MAG: hypothetical protein AAF493_19725 [Pseudomonadota bacterium]
MSITTQKEEADIKIEEKSDCRIEFNVMPDRPVEEILHIREYRCGDRYIEAHFDRTYRSSMLKSPSHLIFLSAVVHYQKLLYVYACRHLGLTYDPQGPEVLKIWPTMVHVEMPRMVRNEVDIVHRVHIDSFERLEPKRYMVKTHSDVNDAVFISGETPLYVL